jgi:hypothetical protein
VALVISLERALEGLLHRRSYRSAFLEGRLDALDLSPEDRDAVASLDPEQVVRMAELTREHLMRREHRGSGGLIALFPRTIQAWRAAHPDDPELHELSSSFMESDPFERHRELPFAGPGLSLEEAFYRFCEIAAIGDPAAREQEFCAAIVKALLLSPNPDFTLPEEVRSGPAGRFALSLRKEPLLFAATRGRYVEGPITPFLADLLLFPGSRQELAFQHGVSPSVLEASTRQLVSLGLLPA